jgi:XTP/dITP diphosphohydrolase
MITEEPRSAMDPRPARLWLASTSAGKLREFAGAARAGGIDVRRLPGIERRAPCVEDGLTFEANARKKAEYYSRDADGMTFADDSGIAVDALGGAPGIYSARFSGPGATDDANNARLLDELRRALGPGAIGPVEAPHPGAAARYVCVIALAERGRTLAVTQGQVDGIIVAPPRGLGGFGYDPYFFFPPLGKTFAELSPEAKFAVSHRGEAFRRLLDQIGRMEIAGFDAAGVGPGQDRP